MSLVKSPERSVTLTELRRRTGQLCRWAEVNGGRVAITRHGQVMGVLVPVAQAAMLAKFEATSPRAERERLEEDYQRFKRAIEGQRRDSCVTFARGQEPEGW